MWGKGCGERDEGSGLRGKECREEGRGGGLDWWERDVVGGGERRLCVKGCMEGDEGMGWWNK